MLNSRSQASTNDNSTTNVDGELRQATLAQNPLLCAAFFSLKIIKLNL